MSNIFFNPNDYTIKLNCNSENAFIHDLRFSNLSYVKTVSHESLDNKNYGEAILSDSVGNQYTVSIECNTPSSQDVTQILQGLSYDLGVNEVQIVIHFKTSIILGILNYLTFKLDNNDSYQDGEIGIYLDECLYSYSTEECRKDSTIIVFKDVEKHKLSPNEVETYVGVFNNKENESLSVPIIGNTKKNDDIFTIRFSNIRLGQVIQTENIEIEGCTFVKDVETHQGVCGYKVFKDDGTNKEVILRIYSNVSHEVNGNVLQNFKYLVNHTNYDSLNIECNIFQNGVDLSGRSIIYNQNLSNEECYNVELTTLFNGYPQSSSTKKITPFRISIPSTYETDIKYTILILLESDVDKVLSLYNARFDNLTFNNVLTTSTADIDNTEVIQFINTLNSNNVTCELYESSKRHDSFYPYMHSASFLFNPNTANAEGETQTLTDTVDHLYYRIKFNSKLPKKIIKSFQVGVGENATNFECNVKFKLYNQLDNKLLYETELYNTTRELLTPFKDYE